MVRRARQRGFTIVELCAAFAIVTVLAVALVHTGHGKAQSMTRAFHETLALRLCQAEIERARLVPAELVPGEYPFALAADEGRLPAGRGMRAVRQIEPGLFEIEVLVAWRPAAAQSESSVNLVTRQVSVEELR